ncbi:hypothetical protein AAFF_G00169770 [Aldrovandia affinis]|uniref:Ig-like domain-containing protein n=1 Tax=Aldrovandia affinis TaxID=143900 RepID=A0AAD7RLT1_9TELE|nr:hypothetical protein AAFF_G00169770 [Aldrovandia affinis]
MISWLLLACALTLEAHPVSQFPELVEVEAGGTGRLHCDVDEISPTYCYTVVWTRISLRTRKMSTCKFISTEHATLQNVCSINIENATVDDSGTYYCSVIHGKMIFTGNGSTLIVRKERKTAPPPIEILWSSDNIHRSFVPLMCLLIDVVPQQARVFWLVDGEEKSGLTGSIWTKDGDAVIESTQNQVLVPAEVWERGASCTCVVEFDGRIASKSVERQDYWTMCYAVVVPYRALGVTACLMLWILIVTVAVCCRRNKNSGKRKKSIARE